MQIAKQKLELQNKEVGIAYVIVSKKTNTRFFRRENRGSWSNPTCGIVVDNIVTLPERFEFFLVSQNTNQGTVSPTNYNVIYNTANLTQDNHQRLAYFLTHLYYNWAVGINLRQLLAFISTFLCEGNPKSSGSSAVCP